MLDARDPLQYFSEDLVNYALEISPTKRSFLLLNKADLLSEDCRAEWARWFDEEGLDFAFWSARNAVEEAKEAKLAAMLEGEGRSLRREARGRRKCMSDIRPYSVEMPL